MKNSFYAAQCAVYNCLGVGKENAVSRAELMLKTRLRDRMVRESIEALRKHRAIINLEYGDGYYIPTDTPEGYRETEAWIARQGRRIQSIKMAMMGAERFVAGGKQAEGSPNEG